MNPPRRWWSFALIALAATIAVVGGVVLAARPDPGPETIGVLPERSSGPSGSSTRSVAPTVGETPMGSLAPIEQAFLVAFVGLADDHNRACTEILLANPLAEFDLVGSRLIDRLIETRAGLDELPRVSRTAPLVGDLADAMADTISLLQAVDPHGPRVDQATAYQVALDQWVARVQPVAREIRAVLGLPNTTTGDLQL